MSNHHQTGAPQGARQGNQPPIPPSPQDSAHHPFSEQQHYPPPYVTVPQQGQTHSPISQRQSVPHSVRYAAPAQPQFEEPGHVSRGPQREQFSTYYQQPQNSVSGYQQSSAPQYHDPQSPPPSSGYPRYPEPEPSPARYPNPMTHVLPSENTATSDVRHRKRDDSTPRDQRGPTGSTTCRLSVCGRPVTMDMDTHELSEYCSIEHLQEDLRHGAPPCPACKRSPRRLNGNYCGSCGEGQRHQRRAPIGHSGFDYHPTHPLPPQSVRCPRCGQMYGAAGRSGNQSEIPGSLPPCPKCGFYPQPS